MIEPHHAVTVATPVIRTARQDEARTLADYLANIASRFPECVTADGLANPVALARRENRAMRHHMSISPMARQQWDKTGHSQEAIAKIVEASNRRGEVSTALVVEALTEPMTQADIVAKTGIPKSTVSKALERALDAGKVFKRKLKSVAVWERRMEAAE